MEDAGVYSVDGLLHSRDAIPSAHKKAAAKPALRDGSDPETAQPQ